MWTQEPGPLASMRVQSLVPSDSKTRMLHLHDLIQRSHNLEAELVAHLGEVDARRLYLEQACSSMFNYCVDVLHFAEAVAYKRIAVARAARKFPVVLAALEKGDLHLTGACLIAPHLGEGGAEEWVSVARHATAREIKQRIADRKPKPDVKTSVRKSPPKSDATQQGEPAAEAIRPTAIAGVAETLSVSLPPASAAPTSHGSMPSATSLPPAPLPVSENENARCQPLGAERYCVRFMADRVVHAQLLELQALLRPSIPDGDVAKILAQAVGALLDQVKKRKIGTCSSPRSPRASTRSDAGSNTPSRHIPAAIRREVWARDGGRCTYVSPQGRSCGAEEFLEYHHQVPWAHCREHAPSNISLRCRSHNLFEAELAFGAEYMAAYRPSPSADRAVKGAEPGAPGKPESQLDANPVELAKRGTSSGNS